MTKSICCQRIQTFDLNSWRFQLGNLCIC